MGESNKNGHNAIIGGVILVAIRLLVIILNPNASQYIPVLMPGIIFAVLLFFRKKSIFLVVAAIVNYVFVNTGIDMECVFYSEPMHIIVYLITIFFFVANCIATVNIRRLLKYVFWLPAVLYFSVCAVKIIGNYYPAMDLMIICFAEAASYFAVSKWLIGDIGEVEKTEVESLCEKLQANA